LKFPLASAFITSLLALAGTPVAAETLAYQSVGEFGEVVFSDIEQPSSETIVLPESEAAGLSSDELISQMLSVAQSLEQARLTRETQREALRRSRQAQAPITQQQAATPEIDRYPLFYPIPHRPGHGHHPKPPIKPTPRVKTFRFEPDL
jgi:hypothetical protein